MTGVEGSGPCRSDAYDELVKAWGVDDILAVLTRCGPRARLVIEGVPPTGPTETYEYRVARAALSRLLDLLEAAACPGGGEHEVKFNGGDPVCIKCGSPQGPGRLVIPVQVAEDGAITARIPGDG